MLYLFAAHPNVKAFITHCGLLGVEEAIYEAKPMVLIPFFVDQPGNAALLEEHGVGIYLDYRTLTKAELVKAIRRVIDDKRLEIRSLLLCYKPALYSFISYLNNFAPLPPYVFIRNPRVDW